MNLDVGADRHVDTKDIPNELEPFILLAKRLGFREQRDQDLFARQLSDSRKDEASELVAAGTVLRARLSEWNASLTGGDPLKIAALADDSGHPYWAFDDAVSVIDLLDVGDSLTPDAKARANNEALKIRYGDVAEKAEQLFRDKDYRAYVITIEPYESILPQAQQVKLNIARKRI